MKSKSFYTKFQSIIIGVTIALLITVLISQFSEMNFLEIFIYAFFIAAGGNLGYYFSHKIYTNDLPEDLRKIEKDKKLSKSKYKKNE